MEFSFFFYSAYSSEALHDGILDFIKSINGDSFADNGKVITSYPIRIWFDDDMDISNTNEYTQKLYGMSSDHELELYVYSKGDDDNEEVGLAVMFRVINFIITEFEVEDFVLEDPAGPWVIKSVNGVKQLRDTDVFEYPFELLECSADFERCSAERYD